MSIGSIRRLPNTIDMGYQHSYDYELPNPATSSRQIILLVPDFSQGSDPSGIIQPPHYHDQGTNNLSQTRLSLREQSKTSLPSKKKRRCRKSSFSSSTRSTSSGSHKRSKKSKRSRHSHKMRKRRSPSPSSSSNSTQSEHDYGRYKRVRTYTQVTEAPAPMQPVETVNINPVNISPVNIAQDISDQVSHSIKDPGSDTDTEIRSFDRATNGVFMLLPQELCPKIQQEKKLLKPLSGIGQLMESRSVPLLVLPQTKLVEKTTKFIQSRIDMEKCCKDWICPQNLVSSLAPTKFYKSRNHFFPTDNI